MGEESMLVQEAFEVLKIKKTNDRRKIKIAYKRLLPSYNPEDDEAAFLRLRQAYEVADKYAAYIEDDEEIHEDNLPIQVDIQTELKSIHITEDTPEEKRLKSITKMLENIDQSPDTENDIQAWEQLFENDIFLSLEYGYAAKMRVVEYLTGKYMLKSRTIQYICEQMEQTEQNTYLWDAFPEEYAQFWLNKKRDIYGYTDFSETFNNNKNQALDKKALEIFFKNYICDDQFLFWQHDYMNSTKWSEEGMEVLRNSKLGEYFSIREYIDKNREEIVFPEKETDRLVLLAHLDIVRAWEAEKRRHTEAVKLWHQADEKIQKVLLAEPEHKVALIMSMAIGAELYDFDKVAAGYEIAVEKKWKNPWIYIFMAEAYFAVGKTDDAQTIFRTAKRRHISNYQLRMMHLHFRKKYDFIDYYDLEGALEEGHALFDEMRQNGVCGELLAEMYYTMGCLLCCDGRYTNAGEYADWAFEICKKPKYVYLKAIDNLSNDKKNYADALELLEEVYHMRPQWDDEETHNPRFSWEVDYDVGMYLGNTFTTDLFTLYVSLGCCYEKTDATAKALDFYQKAILIKPDVLSVVAAFERMATLLLEEKKITVEELVQILKEFSDKTLVMFPCKFLRARLAYEQGDEESAIQLATEITRIKDFPFYEEQSFLEEYRKFAHHLKAKIYIKQEKYQIAKMSLRAFGHDDDYRIAENRKRMRSIYEEVEKYLVEMNKKGER